MENKKRNYLLKRRQDIGAMQSDVAKAVGVSEATISRWESGEIKSMKADKVPLLAKALRINPSYMWEYITDGFSADNLADILRDVKMGRSDEQYSQDTGIPEDMIACISIGLITEPPTLDVLNRMAQDNPIWFIIEGKDIFMAAGYSAEESERLGNTADRVHKRKDTIQKLIKLLPKLNASDIDRLYTASINYAKGIRLPGDIPPELTDMIAKMESLSENNRKKAAEHLDFLLFQQGFIPKAAKKSADVISEQSHNEQLVKFSDLYDPDYQLIAAEPPAEYGTYTHIIIKILKTRHKKFDNSLSSNEIRELLSRPEIESVIKKATNEFYDSPDLDEDYLMRNLAILIEKDHGHIEKLLDQGKPEAASDYINEQLKNKDQFLEQ